MEAESQNLMGNGSTLDLLEAETFTEFRGNGDCPVEEFSSCKRKREPLSEMLNWTKHVAKHPFDLADQLLPEPSSLKKSRGGQDFLVQMLRARAVLSVRKHAESNNGSSETFTEFRGNGDCPVEEFSSCKRKREPLSEMLNWTKHVAKHPFDLADQLLPEPSILKKSRGGQDFLVQMLRARAVLSVRKHAEPNNGSSSKKVKMHPAMYDDPVALVHQGTAKGRCCERFSTSVKPHCRFSCCNLGSVNGKKLNSSKKCPVKKTTAKADAVAKKKKPTDRPNVTKEKKSTAKSDVTEKKKSKACVSIGRRFQAEIPEWTGVVSETDSIWLGTQLWSAGNDSKPTTETDLIERGRQDNCSCNFQGSLDCVRFHIAENRMKVKLELGSAFYHMGFDKMGEEVSLRWTADEQKNFKEAMRLKVPFSLWTNLSKYFEKKTIKDMMSYYFNSYLIRLRSYQNRLTPKDVDSDDDEVEFGSFGDGFGRKALKHPYMEFMKCSVNKQRFDFECTKQCDKLF